MKVQGIALSPTWDLQKSSQIIPNQPQILERSMWARVSGGERDTCAQTCACMCVAEMAGDGGGRGSCLIKEVTSSLRQWKTSKGTPAGRNMVRLGQFLSKNGCLSSCYLLSFPSIYRLCFVFLVLCNPFISWFLHFLTIYQQVLILSPAS